MPWSCKECSAAVADDATPACPACGAAKASWTVVQDRTRTMVVAVKKRLEPLRGREPAPSTTRSATPYSAAEWLPTEVATAMPKGRARALLAAGLLPGAADVLTLRAPDPATTSIRVTTLPAKARGRDVELPARAAGGRAEARLLPVFGALEDPVDDIVLPGVATLDVSDRTDQGHAPSLEVSLGGKGKRKVRLEAPGVVRCLLTGLLADLDKTFLLPGALPAMKALKRIWAREVPREVLVVGHADATGAADYNAGLSRRRAEVVGAYLRDDVAAWLAWYQGGHPQGKPWGVVEDQHMLSALANGEGAFYAGPVDGAAWTPATQAAVKRFQVDANARDGAGLAEDGLCGPRTREALVRRYQAADGTTLPAGARLLVHGCGEYHPAVQTQDGVAEQENRRMELFFFPAGAAPPPVDPCPGPTGCAEHAVWLGNTVRTIDLRHGLGGLDVRVLDVAGQPVEGAAVHLTGVGADQGTSGADGRVVFQDEVPGPATLLASKQGFLDGSAEVEVPAGGASTAVDLVLQPNHVDIVVERRPGRRLAFDRLELRSDDGEFSRTLRVDEAAPLDGDRALLRFVDLPPGRTFSLYEGLGARERPAFRRVGHALLLPRGSEKPADRGVLGPSAEGR